MIQSFRKPRKYWPLVPCPHYRKQGMFTILPRGLLYERRRSGSLLFTSNGIKWIDWSMTLCFCFVVCRAARPGSLPPHLLHSVKKIIGVFLSRGKMIGQRDIGQMSHSF